jgi:glutamine amidotransferase
MIAIVDYGLGNLGSIQNMLRKIGSPSIITSDYREIEQATKLILPGVGAFDSGIKKLNELELVELLNKKVLVDKIPVLGVCLGVQLMVKSSEEGILPGLGWFDAETVRFDFKEISGKYSLPNMGWQDVHLKKDSPLYENMPIDSRFYFVHNFHLKANNEKDINLTASYGYEYVVGLEHENILGVQFHPEKSHKFGMKLYQNFVNNY